ncbi:hypothetical protein FBY04_106268 [Pseudomonas sp. SJZ080]|uniref:hypothetical protein n=1 Tax=Pseudomonas sp. SJZ080 TaxID=2572888 RepID=UPI00119B31C6|nr:hypothetical protein [Pseudomonas sp. SJZ080]TWC57224.1 hypothetical protein FBY04_106268 [Pseudomonas sp. SJZ080]
MTQKSKTPTTSDNLGELQPSNKKNAKTCFVIMPIADMDGYDDGHFSRVYEHLIKPACINAGFEPHRADFVAASNYIIIDILRKILDSDIVICDLSGRNPNVLYELGVRQAFNLPTVLIKDYKTPKIFDIQGLRYTEYNHTLRIDEVQKERDRIQLSISETAANPHDINSMIQLLGVQAAPLPHKVELSNETSVILESLKDISARISNIESSRTITPTQVTRRPLKTILQSSGGTYTFNGEDFEIGNDLFISGKKIGQLVSVSGNDILIQTSDNAVIVLSPTDADFKRITTVPF